MKNEPVVVKQSYNASVERVWQALTNKELMKKWYFDLKDFRAEPGFKFQFTGGPSPERQYVHVCEVTQVVPLKKLAYSWGYEGYEGTSEVSFELREEGGKTLLTLTHDGLENFPKENPDFAKNNFIAGWNEIIPQIFKNFLENTDYQNIIYVEVKPEDAFATLSTRINEWWSEDFSGSAAAKGDTFTVRFGEHFINFEVEESNPDKVIWKCTDAGSGTSQSHKKDWQGSRLIWEILPVTNGTKIYLTHEGLSNKLSSHADFESGWKQFFSYSLPEVLKGEKGRPWLKKAN